MKSTTLLLLMGLLWICIAPHPGSAQNAGLRKNGDNQNGWAMYFGTLKLNHQWSLHTEAQFRRNEYFSQPQQLLLRIGINHHFSHGLSATVGYGFVETYPYGIFPVQARFPEHRMWEQLQHKTNLGGWEWINRLRLEQRWLQLPVADTSGQFEPGAAVYTHRFRLMNRIAIPLTAGKIEKGGFYLSFYDEIFVQFGKNVKYNLFDQNRLYGALGYQLSEGIRLEAGYLLQTLYKPDGIRVEQNHTLQLGITTQFGLITKKQV